MSSKDLFPIKYIGIYSFQTKSILINYIIPQYSSEKTRLLSIADSLLDKLNIMSICNGERHTESSFSEKICLEMDGKGIFSYIIIGSPSYSERFSFGIIKELKESYGKDLTSSIIDTYSKSTSQLKDRIVLSMVELERKYRDPSKISVIHAINDDLKDVSKEMKGNIMSIINNQDTLSSLNTTSHRLNEGASLFYKSSKETKSYFKWENKKFAVIGGGAALLGVIGFFVFKII